MASFLDPSRAGARSSRSVLLVLIFWAAFIFTAIMATLPKPPALPIDAYGDKFEHMLAFATLALLASVAFPRFPLPRIAERLSFLGALIEVVQSIPALHRDCDIMDWIADTISIVVVLLLVAAYRRLRHGPAMRRP